MKLAQYVITVSAILRSSSTSSADVAGNGSRPSASGAPNTACASRLDPHPDKDLNSGRDSHPDPDPDPNSDPDPYSAP